MGAPSEVCEARPVNATHSFVSSLLLLSLGCGTNVDDLFGPSTTDGSGGAHATTTAVTSGSPTTGATTGSQSGPQSASSSGASVSGATSSVSSTSSGPLLPTVNCDASPCMPGQVCCFYKFGGGNDACAQAGQCPQPMSDFVVLACDGPSDCPGEECCGGWNNQDGWLYTKCANHCGGQELVMCSGSPSACGALACKPSMALGAGYSYCGN